MENQRTREADGECLPGDQKEHSAQQLKSDELMVDEWMSDGFDEEREITGGQRMKFLGLWKMIFLTLSPETRSYMIMNPIYQTDGVTVVIKSCILKSLKQTVVISKTLPMGEKHLPGKIIYAMHPKT